MSRMVLNILRGGQPRCLFLLWSSWHIVWVWAVFKFSWDTLFKFLLSSTLVWWYSQVFPSRLFFKCSDFFVIWSFYSFCHVSFPAFQYKNSTFSLPNSIPMSWLYILTACEKVYNSFSFGAYSFVSSMYIRGLIFSCDLVSLYLPAHFLSMWLSSLIAITNSNGGSASPWNIPLWVLTTIELFPSALNSTLQVPIVFLINFMTLLDILYILRKSIIQL